MVGMSGSKDGVKRGTERTEMSLTCAETVYIPYVGGQTRIEDAPGGQKTRINVSMASSEPTPTKRLDGSKRS